MRWGAHSSDPKTTRWGLHSNAEVQHNDEGLPSVYVSRFCDDDDDDAAASEGLKGEEGGGVGDGRAVSGAPARAE